MKHLFDNVSIHCSQVITRSYSTSFTLGIKLLGKEFRNPVYSIYGFVRSADEIVDSFHGYDKKSLLTRFRADTFEAIRSGISVNPVLNAFQNTVNHYKIDDELIDQFFSSMFMDLEFKTYNRDKFDDYVVGSAEVVGLMCLRVFTHDREGLYDELEFSARKLGSAFQKVNFLRDLNADFEGLERCYFPGIDPENLSEKEKINIEEEIEEEFSQGLEGIRKLPAGARKGVYLAYFYYLELLNRIKTVPAEKVLSERIRIPNFLKIILMFQAYLRYKLNKI